MLVSIRYQLRKGKRAELYLKYFYLIDRVGRNAVNLTPATVLVQVVGVLVFIIFKVSLTYAEARIHEPRVSLDEPQYVEQE